MTKKILALEPPAGNDAKAWAAYLNTMTRYVQIKEDQAHKTKIELLVLWTDYFKPQHLEQFPDAPQSPAAARIRASDIWMAKRNQSMQTYQPAMDTGKP